ncbi:MAG: DUF547 domain-containing protein [Alkalispirochaeta sp.]
MKRNGILIGLLVLFTSGLAAAPQAELWPRWEAHNPDSTTEIDHSAWGAFIDEYLVSDHPSGVNRVRYGDVSAADHRRLQNYLDQLQSTEVSDLNRDEQLAYWINLYNAATVDLIVDNYPLDSIRDLGEGVFSQGPWDDAILKVEGEDLTLNDIEHRIIRPIWQDERIHYVVNCASIGCPNLYPQPLTADNYEEIFEASARDYANHDRGVRFSGNRLVLSSIYDWYVADFGDSMEGVVTHLSDYVDSSTARRLREHDGRVRYEYDWSLNEL